MRYKTLVVDPPWPVRFSSLGVHGKPVTQLPYKSMSLEEIKTFPINDYAENEASLFLWATNTFLPYSFELLKAWKFDFKLTLVWDKTQGMNAAGFTRRAEFLLFSYRGKCPIDLSQKYIPQVFTENATIHSAKPFIIYEMIKDRFPEPRIDIFARKRHLGFDAFGDEVTTDLIS